MHPTRPPRALMLMNTRVMCLRARARLHTRVCTRVRVRGPRRTRRRRACSPHRVRRRCRGRRPRRTCCVPNMHTCLRRGAGHSLLRPLLLGSLYGLLRLEAPLDLRPSHLPGAVTLPDLKTSLPRASSSLLGTPHRGARRPALPQVTLGPSGPTRTRRPPRQRPE